MNLTIDDMYQQIGQLALEVADDLAGKLLIYAEVEDGVISTDLFYTETAGTVRHRLSPKPLKNLICAFWETWRQIPENREWRTMSYVIDDGKFMVDFLYPNQLNAKHELADRRPAVIAKYFGTMPVDYSRPR